MLGDAYGPRFRRFAMEPAPVSTLRASIDYRWECQVTTLLTPEEAAKRIGVCVKTLRLIRNEGSIPYVAVTARKHFYRPEDCDAFLEQRVTTARPRGPTRRKSTRRRQEGNVVSFTQRRREAR